MPQFLITHEKPGGYGDGGKWWTKLCRNRGAHSIRTMRNHGQSQNI